MWGCNGKPNILIAKRPLALTPARAEGLSPSVVVAAGVWNGGGVVDGGDDDGDGGEAREA